MEAAGQMITCKFTGLPFFLKLMPSQTMPHKFNGGIVSTSICCFKGLSIIILPDSYYSMVEKCIVTFLGKEVVTFDILFVATMGE